MNNIINSSKEHTVRVRVDDNTKQQLEQVAENTSLTASEIVRKGIEQQYQATIEEQSFVQYRLHGFNNFKITKNKKIELVHPFIKTIFLQEDLRSLKIELNDGVKYSEHAKEIERYLNHICFNLITQTEADIFQPIRFLEIIKDGSEMQLRDHMTLTDSITIIRSYDADDIYEKIINTPTAIENHGVLYERIFKTLHNPNLIVQFMSLYQLLMELLSKGKPRVEQKNVTDYFLNNKEHYPFIAFKPTRRKNMSFDEDSFTYFRNDIGHSEDTNDMDLYKQLGSQVSCQFIKQLVKVLNDIIVTL